MKVPGTLIHVISCVAVALYGRVAQDNRIEVRHTSWNVTNIVPPASVRSITLGWYKFSQGAWQNWEELVWIWILSNLDTFW